MPYRYSVRQEITEQTSYFQTLIVTFAMTEKEKKLNALHNLKQNIQGLIQTIQDSSNDEYLIDMLLEDLHRVMKEIEELENLEK